MKNFLITDPQIKYFIISLCTVGILVWKIVYPSWNEITYLCTALTL